MRILLAHPTFPLKGGAELAIISLANYLTDHYIPNTIITSYVHPEVRKELKDSRLLLCDDFPTMTEVMKEISRDFDAILAFNEPSNLLANFSGRTPFFWWSFEPTQNYDSDGNFVVPDVAKKVVNKFIKQCFVPDQASSCGFETLFGKKPVIVPYGVDYDFWQEKSEVDVDELYGLKDSFVVLQVGYVAKTKNQLKTLDWFKQVKDKMPGAKLVLAGSQLPDYTPKVMDRINELDLGGNVVFTGLVCQDEIRALFQKSKLYLAPIKGQGGWLSIFDAIACGVPVVVSEDFTGSSIIKEHNLGKVGFEGLMELVGREELERRKSWVRDNLSWESFCKKTFEVIKGVLDENKQNTS